MNELLLTWLEPVLLTSLYSVLALLSGSVLMSLALPTWSWRKVAQGSVYALTLLLPCYLWHITVSLTDSDWPNLLYSAKLVITQSNLGQMWLLLCIANIVAIIALFTPTLTQNTQKITLLSAFFVACLARAASGHAADAGLLSGDVWIHSLHIAAACTWFGIIACYLWAMLKDTQQTHLSDATTHLSEVATLCLLALVLTGFADSLRMYQMADNFWQSNYASLLFIKLYLVVIALALASINRLVIMPRLLSYYRAFYGIAMIESFILLIIICLATLLGASMPDA